MLKRLTGRTMSETAREMMDDVCGYRLRLVTMTTENETELNQYATWSVGKTFLGSAQAEVSLRLVGNCKGVGQR